MPNQQNCKNECFGWLQVMDIKLRKKMSLAIPGLMLSKRCWNGLYGSLLGGDQSVLHFVTIC